MKRIFALFLAFALLCMLPAAGAFADEKDAIVPENVIEYARDTAAPLMKAYMKDPSRGYIGSVVSSAEEIDSLTLGKGYRLYRFDLDSSSSLSASAVPVEEWLFSLDGDNSAKVYFNVVLEPETDSLTYYGAEDAENLSAALSILERLAKKEGAGFAPIIKSSPSGFVVAHSFKTGDRVITVPGSAFKLEGSYYEVTGSDELPGFEEYVAEYKKHLTTFTADASPDLSNLPSGSDAVELLPHLNVGSVRSGFRPYLVPAIACAAVLAAAAAAVLIVLRKKRVK